MKHSKETANEIVQTTLKQFGGSRALFMIGAKHTAYGEDADGHIYVGFRFMKNASKANYCRITYIDGADTYKMEFVKIPRNPTMKQIFSRTSAELAAMTKPVTIEAHTEVYGDMLADVFSNATKLATVMPRIYGLTA